MIALLGCVAVVAFLFGALRALEGRVVEQSEDQYFFISGGHRVRLNEGATWIETLVDDRFYLIELKNGEDSPRGVDLSMIVSKNDLQGIRDLLAEATGLGT